MLPNYTDGAVIEVRILDEEISSAISIYRKIILEIDNFT